MEMTQSDYDERLTRVADGTADDEDRRLVKHYEREGFEPSGDAPADASWLVDTDGTEPPDYSKLTKKQLVSELENRKDANGDPLVFDRQASNASLVEQLQDNDQLHSAPPL